LRQKPFQFDNLSASTPTIEEDQMSAMRIIDSDGHVFESREGMAKHLPFTTHRPFFPPLDHLHAQGHQTAPGTFPRVGPGEWIEFMDEVGIESAALYGGLTYGFLRNADWAIAATRAYNDWLHEDYTGRSPRFIGMGLIPLQEPQAAAAELRRIVTELGMRGAMLPANGLPEHLGAKTYWPLYEEADRLGCALAVHGGIHNYFGLDTLNAFVPVHALGHPFTLMAQFAGIVFNGILDRFPNTRFAFLEGGVGWLPLLFERFNGSYESFFDYNPSGQLLSLPEGQKVSDYLLEHIRAGRIYVGCEGDEWTLQYVAQAIGSDCLLYSSDFPHEVTTESCKEEIQKLMDNAGLSDADRESILYRNSERFYKLGA
jgi:predicted TIM-barrel fold metal-dependent hydrolase